MTVLDLEKGKRYRDILLLLWKYGRSDLVHGDEIQDLLESEQPPQHDGDPLPEELADDLEKLGPTFVKLGQLLSTRPDLVSSAYIEPLERLQDDLEPFPFEQVREIVEDDLGVRLSKAFESFEETPIGAASLAQVHRARLRDGRRVAVKVQRPGIREEVARDLDALRSIVEFLDRRSERARAYDLASVYEEFERTLLRELDFRREAAHLKRLRKILEEYPRIVAPAPIDSYVGARVLTMEYVTGTKINELNPVVQLDIDGADLAQQLFRCYLEQVLVDGMFHADPHPGNVLLTFNHDVALIDLGMVGHVRADHRKALLRLLLALSEGKGVEVADIALEISLGSAEGRDESAFRTKVADIVNAHADDQLSDLRPGALLMETCALAASCGVRLPATLGVLGKTLLNLDQIGLTLDPTFDPAEAVQSAANGLMMKHTRQGASRESVFATLLEAKEFAEKLPDRLNRILEKVADNQLRVEVDAIDEHALIRSMEKIANRITSGLVLAALIVGAAMLMRVDTRFTIFGYPGLAIVLFLMATVGGIKLVWDSMREDTR